MRKLKEFVRDWLAPPKIWQWLIIISHLILKRNAYSNLLKDNAKIKNRHVGTHCFILGAGSSIKKQNLRKLEGEFIISVSNTFVHPDFSLIKPQYHALPPLIQSHGQLYSEQKFVDWLRTMEVATGKAEMFLHIGDKEMIDRNELFRNRIIHWVDYIPWTQNFNTPIDLAKIPHIWSVSELAISAAIYLGFDEIYLLGIDHDWFNGSLIYFYDHSKDHKLTPSQNKMKFADAEFQMRRHADIFNKYKYLYSIKKNIYNANADLKHYLDVFPKINYDSLFDKE